MHINHILDSMYGRIPLYHQNFPVILFWSQKSGCSSLAKWFFFQLNLLEEALKLHPSIHYYRENVYFNNDHTNKLINALITKEKPTIKLVRNPYTRTVSSFLHLVHYHDDSMFKNLWDKLNKHNKGVSFKQFLYEIQKIGTDLPSINGHIAKQYMAGEEIWVQEIIKLENLSQSIANLENKYNMIKSPINTISKSLDHKSSFVNNTFNEKNIPDKLFSQQDVLNRNLPKYEKFYDAETKQLCYEIFKEDFIKYNYSTV